MILVSSLSSLNERPKLHRHKYDRTLRGHIDMDAVPFVGMSCYILKCLCHIHYVSD